jgi:putative ABC transport system permease protein
MWNDLKFAVRQLRKHFAFTTVAVLTLAFGIGANTAIFTVINSVLLRPLPYPNSDRLMRIQEQLPVAVGAIAFPNFLDWKAQQTTFQNLAAWNWNAMSLTGAGDPLQLGLAQITGEFFEVFQTKPLLGRFLAPDDDKIGAPATIVLSESIWKSRFGSDLQIIGKPIELAGQPFTVIGVAPALHQFPRGVDGWISLGRQADQRSLMQRDNHPGICAIGRIKNGVTMGQAKADLDTIATRLEQQYPDSNKTRRVYVDSMLNDNVHNVRRALYILCGAVAFVLLIACTNVANLLLARAASREKEMAMRAALGAERWQIIRQLVVESSTLAVLGCGLGLLLAQGALALILSMAGESIPRAGEIHLDGTVVIFTVGIASLTGILFGLAPAWFASRVDLEEGLKSASRGTSLARPHLRHSLVIAEVALTMLLLIGAGLLMRSFTHLYNVNPGYEVERTLTFRLGLPESRYRETAKQIAFERELMDRLKALPGVLATSAASRIPLDGDRSDTQFLIEGRPEPPPHERPSMDAQVVDIDYFKATGIPIMRGRAFTDADNRDHLRGTDKIENWTAGLRAAIIDEEFAKRYWPNEDALGKRIILPWEERAHMEIVGIVPRIKLNSLDEKIDHVRVYFPFRQTPLRNMTVIVKTAAEPTALVSSIRKEIAAIDRQQPISDIHTLEELRQHALAPQRFNFTLLTIFAAVALALAVIGLYGVLAYTVAQRRREIGVRVALGAQWADVVRMITSQGMRLTIIGVAIGLVAAAALTQVMERLLFEVNPLDPITYVVVTVLLAAVAGAASFIPARKAASIDPMVALRYE